MMKDFVVPENTTSIAIRRDANAFSLHYTITFQDESGNDLLTRTTRDDAQNPIRDEVSYIHQLREHLESYVITEDGELENGSLYRLYQRNRSVVDV